MDQSFDDLLSGAFSDMSDGFLEKEDLDFESISSDHKLEVDTSQKNPPTKEDEAQHQEATGEASPSTDMGNKDVFMADSVYEDQTRRKHHEEYLTGDMRTDKTPQEGFTSSDSESGEESSESADDEVGDDIGAEGKPGGLLMSVHCDGFSYDSKEDELFAEEQPLAPQGSDAPNEEQDEGEVSEELSYFRQVPGRVLTKGDGTGEDEQEEQSLSPSSEQEIGYADKELSEVQDLAGEDDPEECEGKMKDFSGEEHQEAGESFADYPSDFSSCEYVEDKGNTEHELERAVTDPTWTGGGEEGNQEEEESPCRRDSEVDAHEEMNLQVAREESGRTKLEIIEHSSDDADEGSESESYSSSDDDVQEKRYDELSLNRRLHDLEDDPRSQRYTDSGAAYSSLSDDARFTSTQVDVSDFNINWDFNFTSRLVDDLLNTVDTGSEEMQPAGSDVHPADANSYSAVQREDSKSSSSSYQGSVDDGFFFNNDLEASTASELGQFGDDEYEEERNWEQEKERIEAFYKFYDDDIEENGREERQTKVQFCADPLSQVIHYGTDSDSDSLRSSTDEDEEDLSSTEASEELREPDDTQTEMEPVTDPPVTEIPHSAQESDVCNTQICTRKRKCGGVLKQMLKMGLVLLTGTVMFWLATDQADWLGQISFF